MSSWASPTTPRSLQSSSTFNASALPPACRRARSRPTSWPAPTRRTATRNMSCCSRRPGGMFSHWRSQSFDLAERLQTPVIMLSDLDIGMNDWMVPGLQLGRRLRGRTAAKSSTAEEFEKIEKVPPLSRCGRRRHSLSHTARRASRKAPFSPVAPATTSTARTPRTPTDYQDVVDRLLANGRRRAESYRSHRRFAFRATFARLICLRQLRRGRARGLDRLAAAGVNAQLHARAAAFPFDTQVHDFLDDARRSVCRRAESRCPVADAADARDRAEPRKLVARAALQRHSRQCGPHRRGREADFAEDKPHEPHQQTQSHASRHAPEFSSASRSATMRAAMSTLCAGCGHDSITAAIIQAVFELDARAAHDRENERHRLLVEDAGLLREPVARLQLRARPHAVGGHRRQRRKPGT